ncbi:MAG TPA: permease-like cell division protein FtsX [Gemmatimonadaceae bacterium]|jgi:cell division transport system permease protein|nr:permease-like cell division protein FtsX [Gemmatimonadaceae bacterium]
MRLTLREVLLGVRRSPLLSTLSVVTIAFSLFAFGLFGLLALNVDRALRGVEEHVEIVAFLADGTLPESISAAMGDISAFPEVAHVDQVSPEQALARARAELPEFQDVFDASFLPPSIEVRLKEGHRDPATVKDVTQRIQSYPFVDDVRYGEDWVKKLYDIRNIAGAAGLALGLLFAAVAVIIIGTTIRMTVLARAREISIMRLVGATDSFVRRPFLIDGFLKGLVGGLLALLLTWGANAVISQNLIQTTFFDPGTAMLGVIGGSIIGVLGSALSVGRHLRRV